MRRGVSLIAADAVGMTVAMVFDSEGNVYTAFVDADGAHKLRPRKGANPDYMLGKPLRVAWK